MGLSKRGRHSVSVPVTRRTHLLRSNAPYEPKDCHGIEFIGSDRPWPEYHRCELEMAHYGRHVCWCGTPFGLQDANWRQIGLPDAFLPRSDP